jgi:hypothetical protein
MPPASDPVNQTSSGGDFMTDVLNSLGIEYLAINCASSYRGLHEAVINHANNKPKIITCVHEDIAVHLAQGYAKIEGKPIAMACHGVVGLQHATMAMYNAWCDRVGHRHGRQHHGGGQARAGWRLGASGNRRRAIVRDFTKWDDQPASLQHFAETGSSVSRSRLSPWPLSHLPWLGRKTPRKATPPTASASTLLTAASPVTAAPVRAAPIPVRRQSSPTSPARKEPRDVGLRLYVGRRCAISRCGRRAIRPSADQPTSSPVAGGDRGAAEGRPSERANVRPIKRCISIAGKIAKSWGKWKAATSERGRPMSAAACAKGTGEGKIIRARRVRGPRRKRRRYECRRAILIRALH